MRYAFCDGGVGGGVGGGGGGGQTLLYRCEDASKNVFLLVLVTVQRQIVAFENWFHLSVDEIDSVVG